MRPTFTGPISATSSGALSIRPFSRWGIWTKRSKLVRASRWTIRGPANDRKVRFAPMVVACASIPTDQKRSFVGFGIRCFGRNSGAAVQLLTSKRTENTGHARAIRPTLICPLPIDRLEEQLGSAPHAMPAA